MQQELIAQSLDMQYNIIQTICKNEKNFDRDNIKEKIDKILSKVTTTNEGYNKFKGEFLAINEPIMNKDILNFKLEKVQR